MALSNESTKEKLTGNLLRISVPRLFTILALLLPLCAVASAQPAPLVSFQLTPFNVPGALTTTVNGIDNSGNMVGTYVDQSGVPHGFEFTSAQQLINIDYGFYETVCYGVVGQTVVGAHVTPAGWWQAFYYSQGTFLDLPIKDGVRGSGAYGINVAGLIVGWYQDSNTFVHGFEWNGKGPKGYKTIDAPGMIDTVALAINHKGWITLHGNDSNGLGYGWLKKGKNLTQMNNGQVDVWPLGISDTGDIVIAWANGSWHGGLLLKSGFYTFDEPQSGGTWFTGINTNRNIVGYYRDPIQQINVGLKGSYLP